MIPGRHHMHASSLLVISQLFLSTLRNSLGSNNTRGQCRFIQTFIHGRRMRNVYHHRL
jgi:hypothetical protein